VTDEPKDAVTVLLVEDADADAELFRRAFASGAKLTCFLRARDIASAKDLLLRARPDCVVLDLGLPDSVGLSGLRQIRALDDRIPIVILTGLNDEGVARAALRDGAREYVVKGQLDGEALGRALLEAVRRQLQPGEA
jgi:DNA-binding NarL/FixJ family response regulator